jgi:hypothetical protein
VAVTVYCVFHAAEEQLVAAVGVTGGFSTCGKHEGSPAGGSSPLVLVDVAPCCGECSATSHRAYFSVSGRFLCIRHAADAVFPDDDMGAHDMAHAAYIRLNEMGVVDAY